MKDSSSTAVEPILRYLCGIMTPPDLSDRFDGLDEWWVFHAEAAERWILPIDRAIAGGFDADRVGFAFVAGIQAALRRLTPGLEPDAIVSFCVTEGGGGHPRAIETAIVSVPGGGCRVSGEKKWATLAPRASLLLVAAVRGIRADGRKDLVMVRIPRDARGLTVKAMNPTPFAPEVEHARVRLDAVEVACDAALPGDAYTTYIRPFRTIEDTFVSAAVAAFLLRVARGSEWPERETARLLSLLAVLRTVACGDPGDAGIHVLLDAALGELADLGRVDGAGWQRVPAPVRERWERDIGLMSVGATVRAKRLERARERLHG